jgi:hypothetical protein
MLMCVIKKPQYRGGQGSNMGCSGEKCISHTCHTYCTRELRKVKKGPVMYEVFEVTCALLADRKMSSLL